MWKWLGTWLVLSIALMNQSCAPKSQNDCGFVQNVYGERISWKRDVPITMYIHSSVPDSVVPSILRAAETWEQTAGRKLFNIIPEKVSGPANPHQDGQNIIYFMSIWEGEKASEQGRASLYWIGDLIKEADIRINGADYNFYAQGTTLWTATKPARQSSAGLNVEAIILHEMGHVLGLKHNDKGESVMATYLSSGDDRVTVAGVDNGALQCEY